MYLNCILHYLHAHNFRFKNCFFNKKEAKDQAEAALLRLLKAEVASEPVPVLNSGSDQDLVLDQPADGLAGVFQLLRGRGGQGRGGERQAETEEIHLQKYLDSELETVACLKYWENQEKEFGSNKMRAALCRLARYVKLVWAKVVTNLFSYKEVPYTTSNFN